MATPVTLSSQPFRPSSPLTGDENSCVYRAANLLLSGQIGNTQYRSYAGSLNIGENYTGTALTGTISFSPASTTITGVGTSFLDELHIGQLLIAANGEPLEIAQPVSQTSFICGRKPTTTQSGVVGTIPPRLDAMDIFRISLQWGNAILTDKGNILTVGRGTLFKNGAVLPGTSLTASRTVQLSIYDSTSGHYSTNAIGFAVTPLTVNTDVTVVGSGGTKNTGLGFYSFKIGYYSSVTNGYSNPGDTLLSGGLTGYNVTIANSTFNFNFTDDVGNRPTNSTGYVVYATAFTNSSDQSAINSIQGPWYEVIRIPYASLTSNQYAFDYTDADLVGGFVSFDNDSPPDADWVTSLAGYVNLVSCEGQGVNSSSRTVATSPGPFVFPMKGNNIDAYPADQAVPTEKGENIIGCISANGRLYAMTPNTLQVTTPTGLDAAPMTLRPFWRVGFANPYNLVFINDILYGFTAKGMYRSIATGNEAAATNDFASSVNTQMALWEAGYVYLAYDPKNRCVCIFHTGARKNNAGYWITEVYIYNLDIYDWTPPIILSDDTRDMIVTGVATVQNALYFIAGGRRSGTSARFDTFEWDNPASGQAVNWYASWNYTQSGNPLTAKCIRKVQTRGQFTNASVQVYAASPDSTIAIADLETGANSAFSFNLDDSTMPTTYSPEPCRVRNALMWTTRIGGTSQSMDGTLATVDTFDEMTVYVDIFGAIR